MTDSSPLSPQETKVVRLLAEGLTPTAIAAYLGLRSSGTASHYMGRIRTKLGVQTNEQAVAYLAWYHPKVLAGCMIKHGTLQALDWHDEHEIPLCRMCQALTDIRAARVKMPGKRPGPKRGTTYQRLKPVDSLVPSGAPMEHGTIEMARRHIRSKDRINDLTCGCREAYQEWWREYQRARNAS